MSTRRAEYRGFRHPFLMGTRFAGGVGEVPRTVTDLAMSRYSAQLRLKPKWWQEFSKKDVRKKWKAEGLQTSWTVRTSSGYESASLSPRQVDYVLDELTGYAALFDYDHGCQVSCFERIWESNYTMESLITSTLDDLNCELLRSTLAMPPMHRHDGVVTIIDPFLNALVFGKTLVYDIYQPVSLRRQPAPVYPRDYSVSERFAFLPTDFAVSSAGHVKALSYINNLQPCEKALYRNIEVLLGQSLPLFSHVLTDLHRNNPLHQRINGTCRYTEWDEPEPPDHSDDEEGWSTYERDMRQWIMKRPIQLPDVPDDGYQGGLEIRRHMVDLRGKMLQVVVHAYEIRLSPSNPGYVGTPWQVVGMMNERIVACSYFYSSVENVTDSSIEFRMAVTSPSGFEAGDVGATTRTWALKDGDPCHQYVGSRCIIPGLCVVFPNLYQHRHSAFKLVDPLQEGHQRVVAFYLVDPDVYPVISTSRTPPQQKSWIKAAVEESMDKRLPVELTERIIDAVEGKMNQEEAEQYRQMMLNEREIFRARNDQYHFCVPFDIWNSNGMRR